MRANGADENVPGRGLHNGAAGGHGVAVELDGVRLIHDLVDGVVDLLGRGDAGVAQ